MSSDPRPRPLHGVRVLDCTRVLSGPHATRMLCDLGAEVIKVEPPDGDMTRFSNPRVNSFATYFVQQNVGKRNISLDMTRPEALDLLLRLAEQCDVLIENFRPGGDQRSSVRAGNVRPVHQQHGPRRPRPRPAVHRLLGLDHAEIDALAAAGVLSSRLPR